MLPATAAIWMAPCATGSMPALPAAKTGQRRAASARLVTADAIPDPQNLNITTRLNGQTVQQDNTGSMLYSIAELIAYISTFSALSPGDVILTGTPGGIGKTYPAALYAARGQGGSRD